MTNLRLGEDGRVEKRFDYYDDLDELTSLLVGRKVVQAENESGTLTLDNGVLIKFDKENSDCCSWIELEGLATTDNVITAAKFDNTDDDEGPYKAWLHVITEAGEVKIAEADADASNGYYLHGFALGATVTFPDEVYAGMSDS